MSEDQRVPLIRLHTSVPGLDEVLGGGLPEYSLNLVVGTPGSGKTTLVHQIIFATATTERPAIYFTVLGEPPLKMLRYQQQLSFFDPGKVGDVIQFVNLGQVLLDEGLGGVLDRIVRMVEQIHPGIVVLDSFQSLARRVQQQPGGDLDVQAFVERLALHLTSWQATTFLIGEYPEGALQENPISTIADGIIWLNQRVDDNAVVRKIQIMKMRGQAPVPGIHTFRMTADGIRVFPRTFSPPQDPERSVEGERLSTGVPGLDALMNGGIPAGNALLITGPSGTGKSVLAAQFVAEGARHGEMGLVVLFEQVHAKYLRWAAGFGLDLEGMAREGHLHIMPLQRTDLTPDEAIQLVWQEVQQRKVRRLVIDSLTGMEVTVTPSHREELRQGLYRLVEGLAAIGVTIALTLETVEVSTDLLMSNRLISFLADNILIQRYVEIAGRYERVLTVLKMRNSAHSHELRRFEITGQGIVVGDALAEYEGVSTGVATRRRDLPSVAPGKAEGERTQASPAE